MGQYITQQEYDRMKEEFLTTGSLDQAFVLAKKVLYGKIRSDCWSNSYLDPEEDVESIMNEVRLRLWKGALVRFMNNPETPPTLGGFVNWLHTIEKKLVCDYQKMKKRHAADEIPETYTTPEDQDDVEAYDRINGAFAVILSSSTSIHIVLSWLAQNLLIARNGTDTFRSAAEVDSCFRNMTLDDMLDLLVEIGEDVIWLKLDPKLVEKQREKLNRTDKDGRRIGGKKFGDFYTDSAAISKWNYRVNRQFRAEDDIRHEPSDN